MSYQLTLESNQASKDKGTFVVSQKWRWFNIFFVFGSNHYFSVCKCWTGCSFFNSASVTLLNYGDMGTRAVLVSLRSKLKIQHNKAVWFKRCPQRSNRSSHTPLVFPTSSCTQSALLFNMQAFLIVKATSNQNIRQASAFTRWVIGLISGLILVILRFQKAFKTAAGCYLEPWTNVLRSLCPHYLFTDNSFDFWFDSSETFAKSFDSFAILSSRNNPFRNIRSLHEPSFRVGLPRTVCGSVCLSVEKMTPFAKIFDKSAMFDMVERKLRLYYVSAVFPIARDWALWRNPRVNL